MVLRMFASPGDHVLSDRYTYSSAFEAALPMGVHFEGAEIDEQGIISTSLDYLLKNWDPSDRLSCPLHVQSPSNARRSLCISDPH
jgi:aromatic amino acid aminotransferase I